MRRVTSDTYVNIQPLTRSTSTAGSVVSVGRYNQSAAIVRPTSLPGQHITVLLLQLTSIVRPFLMLWNSSAESPALLAQDNTFLNATQNVTADSIPLKIPTDLLSLTAFISSFSAIRDYLKLIIIGGAFETLRRLSFASFTSLLDRFFITATFESDDSSFGEYPLPHYLSHH